MYSTVVVNVQKKFEDFSDNKWNIVLGATFETPDARGKIENQNDPIFANNALPNNEYKHPNQSLLGAFTTSRRDPCHDERKKPRKNRRAATSELTVQRLKQILSSFLFRVWLCVC